MILRARTVVTMDGPPIENGAVAIEGNQIVDVGPLDEVKARRGGEIVDLGEQVLLPGLINAHCHLDYTCLRGKIPAQTSFTAWIREINAAKAELSPEDYVHSIARGFAEAKRFGTTTIANLTAFPELIARIQPAIRTWWLTELIDVREPQRAKEYVDLAVERLQSSEHWGLAPHAPFTASADLFRRCEEIAQRENVLLTTHLAESREEMSMFRDGEGALYEFLKSIGRDMGDCGDATPLQQFVGRAGRASLRDWIVAHLNEVANHDFDLLTRSTTKFDVVHCPRSHKYFGHTRFQFERLRALGFNVCLGTDSLASNDDLSLFTEMREFQQNFPSVPPEQILQMLTVNAAAALRRSTDLGRIRSGARADLIALPLRSTGNIFDEIIAFEGAVTWSMIDGHTRKAA